MNLRFVVNQSEAFRRGINVDKSIQHVKVDPSGLSQEVRDLIADRLDGIDVRKLDSRGLKLECHIVALEPTFESLLDAVRENQKDIETGRLDQLADCNSVISIKTGS